MTSDLTLKYNRLKEILSEFDSVVIGYSGGVDSTLLLKVAVDILKDRVVAVIAKSETYPKREYEQAIRLAESFGARYKIIHTYEINNTKFKENPPDRCYYCKTELFSRLKEIASELGINWIADGTNADDMFDFRPGMKAKQEQNIRSPLYEANLSKTDIREISKYLGLPTWEKGSFACLASRFPYGFNISIERLNIIDNAESYLYDLGFLYFRVRYHDEKTARIETMPNEIGHFLDETIRTQIVTYFKSLGFNYITLDLQGYRTGSLNEVLSNEIKQTFMK